MEFKYKITDVAKDFGVPNKKVIDTLAAVTGETKKSGGTVNEQELNFLVEQLTRETAETSLDAYFASKNEQPAENKPAKAEKPAEKKPAEKKPAAEKKPEPKAAEPEHKPVH